MATKTPKVIISLTSHSIRLKQVAKTTIWSIIQNTYTNKHIVLTLFKDDVKLIPADLRLLIDKGLVELIVAGKDLGPHLKYFYTMQKYRDCPVITVDDDVLYPHDMINKMILAHLTYPQCVIARRSFLIMRDKEQIEPYAVWMRNFAGKRGPSMRLFATGIGGILYPPDILTLTNDDIPEVLSVKYDDDFLLKVKEIRKNVEIVNICATHHELYQKNLNDAYTQSIALWNGNKLGKSDSVIKRFSKEFMYAAK